MSEDEADTELSVPRTITDDLQRKRAQTNPPSLEEQVDFLSIHVDRLRQSNKLLKWAATTAVTFALGAIITVARMLYGMGSEAGTIKAAIERAQRQADENKADLKELQRYVYSRRFGGGYLSSPSIDGKDGQ